MFYTFVWQYAVYGQLCPSKLLNMQGLYLFHFFTEQRVEWKLVLILQLLCDLEDILLSHLFGWWEDRVSAQQGRGGGQRLWRGLITLLELETISQVVGNEEKSNKEKTQKPNERYTWNCSVWIKINWALCCACWGECSGALLMTEVVNYHSQQNKTIHGGVLNSKLFRNLT